MRGRRKIGAVHIKRLLYQIWFEKRHRVGESMMQLHAVLSYLEMDLTLVEHTRDLIS